jgi:hypothetical protein
MNDLMLYARLKDLQMPAAQAWPLAAQIRDTLHPVAHTAAIKIVNAITRQGVGRRGLGATTGQEIQAGSAVAGAAAGAAYGSVVPGIGTAVGAVVGLVASMLIHTGQGALRLQQAKAIEQALSTIPSAFVGRQIPWLGTASAPGLLQFISAIMTGGLYMAWDPSVQSSPSVNGNWSTTFLNAVKALVAAIVNNPAGVQVSVPIVFPPGGPSSANGSFSFVNPGIAAGPDAIAANIIMGPSGLMYWMIRQLGETAEHASANASSGAAQKVFALMVDHATADLAPPATLSTTLANAPLTNVPAAIAAQAGALANATLAQGSLPTMTAQGTTVANITAPVPLNTGTGAAGFESTSSAYSSMPVTQALSPVQDTSAALLQQLLAAQGANLNSPAAAQLLADIAANGVSATPNGPSSMPGWLLPVGLAGAALVVILMVAKK